MGKEVVELVFGDTEPDLVGSVDDEDDGHGVLVVVLPQVAVSALAGHVEDGEVDVVLREALHLEPDRRHNLQGIRLHHQFN